MLFINSVQQRCGVYQYGKRLVNILKTEIEDITYKEIATIEEYLVLIPYHSCIVINYHLSLFPWMSKDLEAHNRNAKYYYIYHEDGFYKAGIPIGVTEESILNTDPTSTFGIPLPRPLYFPRDSIHKKRDLSNPVIGSFGFGFLNKNFSKIITMVQQQFHRATIRLHIPYSYYGDNDGRNAQYISEQCKNLVYKKDITLEIYHEFISDDELMEFLTTNDLNVFLYDKEEGRGCSSVLDFALTANTPVAISNSHMFRHIFRPEICADDTPLINIMLHGNKYIKNFKDIWSHQNLIQVFRNLQVPVSR